MIKPIQGSGPTLRSEMPDMGNVVGAATAAATGVAVGTGTLVAVGNIATVAVGSGLAVAVGSSVARGVTVGSVGVAAVGVTAKMKGG